MPDCDQPGYHSDVHHLIVDPEGTTDIDRLALVCEVNHKTVGPSNEEWLASPPPLRRGITKPNPLVSTKIRRPEPTAPGKPVPPHTQETSQSRHVA